jgi:TRAP transporter TAXI family solute receptor
MAITAMWRSLAVVLGLGLAAMAAPLTAQPLELNIVTGGPTGTYIRIGQDVATLGAECGRSLNVRESAGSLENVFAVRDRPVTQFGIVQGDVLEYIQTFAAEDTQLRRAAQGLRIVYPLYDEEVHILARRDIAGLDGLEGRRVAVGVENSGNFITAQLVLDLARVAPAERETTLAPAAALEALLAGEVDAMVYVAGAPVSLFAEAAIDPERFHLLPLADPVLRSVYVPADLPAGTYPFQSEPLATIAVKAVLVTYDYDARGNAYHRASCEAVSDFSYLILSRIEALRENGHPKWSAVDMTELPPGWRVSDCALAGIAPERPFVCTAPDGTRTTETLVPIATEANGVFISRVCARLGC